jgi:hypothetical protein
MFHERMLYNSPYVIVPVGLVHGHADATSVLGRARAAGRTDDPYVRDLVGRARTLEVVGQELQHRIAVGIRTGHMSDQAAALGRLFKGLASAQIATMGWEVAGDESAAWMPGDDRAGDTAVSFLMRQTACIGGGTTEMARNVVSERVLAMPRERTLDRDVPFRDVPRSRTN